jgi:hypothetical protein
VETIQILISFDAKNTSSPPCRYSLKNPKGSVVTNVLDSSLDLSSYALFCSKGHFMLDVDHGAAGTWILLPCWRLIHSPFLYSNCSADVHFSYFFVTWFRARTRVRWVAHVISDFLLE